MTPIIIANDHAGFYLKEEILKELAALEIPYTDVGVHSLDPIDYPDIVAKAALLMKDSPQLGVFICGTGIGVCMAANRFPWIRAALCHHDLEAALTRQHNNANVLCLGGRTMGPEIAKACLRTFLKADFEGGRHQRRVDKLGQI